MDYFAKFTRRMSTPKRAKPTSAMQLARFEKAWTYCHNTYFLQDKKVDAKVSHTGIPQNLKTMVDLLVEEELQTDLDTANTGICLEYFLRNNVLASLVHLSEADCPAGILGETIRTVASLVNLLDDRFLVHKSVHTPLLNLLRFCTADTRHSPKYQEDLVDLTYLLCSKIHGFPELLHIFFLDRDWIVSAAKNAQATDHASPMLDRTHPGPNGEAAASASSVASSGDASPAESSYEFLLFTYLLQFVHKEGKLGDYARTGLLFLVELTSDHDLSHFVLHSSGMSTLLSASMGALYSQLPRRLMVTYEENLRDVSRPGSSVSAAPPAVATAAGMSAAAATDITAHPDSPPRPVDGTTLAGRSSISEESIDAAAEPMETRESTTSPEFQRVMSSFLKLIEFYQDVLERCPDPALHSSLLQNFQTHFLDTVLYPSLLESSDTDGTAVAVMSYIELILQSLEPGELSDAILQFLLGLTIETMVRPDSPTQLSANLEGYLVSAPPSQAQNVAMSNKGSGSTLAQPLTTSTVLAFTLKDLIGTNLQSSSRPAIISALKLWTTVMQYHCKYTPFLLETTPVKSLEAGKATVANTAVPHTPIRQHRQDIDSYILLLNVINGEPLPSFIPGYDRYLNDVDAHWERHDSYHVRLERDGYLQKLDRALPRRPGRPLSKSRKYSQSNLLVSALTAASAGNDTSSTTNVSGGEPAIDYHDLLPDCDPVKYRLSLSDPLLRVLLHLTSRFFAQSVDLNLALTGAITTLASCPRRELEGLFVPETATAAFPHPALGAPGRDPFHSSAAAPVAAPRRGAQPSLYALLLTLCKQIEGFRGEFKDFEERLEHTRGNLLLVGPPKSVNSDRCSTELSSTPSKTPANGILQPGLWGGEAKGPSTSLGHGFSRTAVDSSVFIDGPDARSPGSSREGGDNNGSGVISSVHTASSTSPVASLTGPSASSIIGGDHHHGTALSHRTAEAESGLGSAESMANLKLVYSSLCENVLILEEFIKELVAVIQVRRSSGRDEISYL
ncbi:hypothetical protein H4R34_000979 [Dimargaris verticillata]|uniref:FHF complex subunit HOOK-interacting protein C-terminal domain-containing protein n=1 Tax=Dimargaris verticillata TaxID=2761393 RepID=A0A9W8BBM7_9FUNG|nr:hypothetical protein H4R34_000979 [Dimargaris verticillata]